LLKREMFDAVKDAKRARHIAAIYAARISREEQLAGQYTRIDKAVQAASWGHEGRAIALIDEWVGEGVMQLRSIGRDVDERIGRRASALAAAHIAEVGRLKQVLIDCGFDEGASVSGAIGR
jgi:hypothetical protein